MNHPGVWILGDTDDHDRRHGMGIVVEYAGRNGKPQWLAPPKSSWNYSRFSIPGSMAAIADEQLEMTFAKQNAAHQGFNLWTINGAAFPMSGSCGTAAPDCAGSNASAPSADSEPSHKPGIFPVKLQSGRRYRLTVRNQSDDIHPIHLHRHTFELISFAGRKIAGVHKDVFMLGGYQQAEIAFVANNPGLTLFHCHQQLHMDFGFMTLFDYL